MHDAMFFKKPEAVKSVRYYELMHYVNSLFDSQVSKTVTAVDRSLSTLMVEAEKFADLSEKFYSADAEPDMEFIEHMSEGFIKSQKMVYSKSLSAILSERSAAMRITADTKYDEAKSRKEAFESMLQEVLRLNSKFSMILVGYSRQMDAFKKQFSRMDRELKQINEQLKGESEAVEAYNSISDQVSHMLSEIDALSHIRARKENQKIDRNIGSDEKLRSAISAIEAERSSYGSEKRALDDEESRLRHRLISLMQPLSRASRIYDHEAKNKIKMADYIGDSIAHLQDKEACAVFEAELRKMNEYVSKNPSKFKDNEAVMAQISDVLSSGIQGSIERIHLLEEKIGAVKEKIRHADSRLHEVVSEKDKLEERFGELVYTEEQMNRSYNEVLDSKGRIERLCLSAYRVRLEITELPAAEQ
ncbi:hypothetical protein B2A_00912 [mine drainage metagenome]|uniref:Uncharacterized protein n=1 Tax=mine drainage metagenome TaxID=410659 RepID=T1CHY9_9ZZZZ